MFFSILVKYRTVNVAYHQYKVHMSLHITKINKDDYDTYQCVSKNEHGVTKGEIAVHSK